MKKNILITTFISLGAALLAALATFLIMYYATVKPLNAKANVLEVNNTKLSEDYNQTKTKLDSATSEKEKISKDLQEMKDQVNTKVKEMNQLTSDIEKVKKDLQSQTVALEKAKRGVAKLAELDKLITSLNTKSEELPDIINKYYEALDANNIKEAENQSNLYDKKILEIEALSKQIDVSLTIFRSGNY